MNTNTGVMESQTSLEEVMDKLYKLFKSGTRLSLEKIDNSKNHNGKTMYVLSEDPGNDVSIYHLEISEDGIFPYIFDDGVS